MNKILEERWKWVNDKAVEIGLDYIPIHLEWVSEEVMLEVMSYGLPTRARHWTYGQSYEYQKIQGEMGASKVYELILNNDPSYAFMLNTNSDTANTLVMAHIIGHSHFFKNNFLFKQTDRKMVYHAAERASRIEEYVSRYGIDRVENVMNAALAIEKNIDWDKGLYREPYASRHQYFKGEQVDEFADLFGKNKADKKEVVDNANFPPSPETDLLWFAANYSNIEPWQKDIFQIIREESFYFYPQYYTKIMNEGLASYIHAELLYLMGEEVLTPEEYIDFVKIHERVVQPGRDPMNINPYFLGFTILNNIKKKWDEKFKNGESEINGFQKILKVVEEEDDISFLRNYLTDDIIKDLKMFTFVHYFDPSVGEIIKIESNKTVDVVESLISKIYNYRAPQLAITKASQDGIEMVHMTSEVGTLDVKHLEKVMAYFYKIWNRMIDVETRDEDGNVLSYTFDELGFSHAAEN